MERFIKLFSNMVMLVVFFGTGRTFAQNTFPTSGNVGIGTTSPSYSLVIKDDFRPVVQIGNRSGALISGSTLPSGSSLGGALFGNNLYVRDGNLKTSATRSDNFGYSGLFAENGYLKFYGIQTNTVQDQTVSLGTGLRMTITPEGNVGINANNPKTKLQVNGGLRIGYTEEEYAGAIRWTGTDFQGYNGETWISLSGEVPSYLWVAATDRSHCRFQCPSGYAAAADVNGAFCRDSRGREGSALIETENFKAGGLIVEIRYRCNTSFVGDQLSQCRCVKITGNNSQNLNFLPFDQTAEVQDPQLKRNALNNLASIYPVPSTGKFNVSFKNVPQNGYEITVFDSLGESKYFKISDEPTLQIDLSKLGNGQYFVKIKSEGQESIQAILKE